MPVKPGKGLVRPEALVVEVWLTVPLARKMVCQVPPPAWLW